MNSKSLRAPAFVLGLVIMFAVQKIACAADSGLLPRFPWPPMPERELNSWRFDSPAWQTNARTAPLALLDVEAVPSWSGFALRLAGTKPAIAAFAATNSAGGVNLADSASSSLRFWFAGDWSSSSAGGTGPGADAVLFETGAWSGENSYVRCSLQVDADGDTIRFVLHGTGGPETILKASLLWNWNEWHQVALVGTATNTLLYLDGSAVASGSAVAWLPSPVSGRVHGFCVGGDVTGGALAQGDFDELYTYARAVTAGEVAFDYNRNSGTAALGPINPEIMAMNSSISFTNKGTSSPPALLTTHMVSSNFGCKLWLEINRPANLSTNALTNLTNVVVTLHNTTPGRTYLLWSKQHLVATQAWLLETNLFGPTNQSFISTNIAMKGRSNLFFQVTRTNFSFAGLQDSNAVASKPDSMGAVGPEHFVEIINAAAGAPGVAAYDKVSGERVQWASTTAFFSVQAQGTNYPTGDITDARMLFDHEGQRWVACGLDLGSNSAPRSLILAVSTNSNPLHLTNWTKHFIPVASAGSKADFPTLGLDKNGIYLSVVYVSHVDGKSFDSNQVVTIKKPELYAGSNITSIMEIRPVPTNEIYGILQPAVNFDEPPRGGYAWFIGKRLRTDVSQYLGGAIAYRRMQWSGNNASWADTNWVTLSDTNYRNYFDLDDGNVLAPQSNSIPAVGLSPTGSRLAMAVIRDGALWTCHHVGVTGTNGTYTSNDTTGTNVDRTAAQWLKLSSDTNGNFSAITNGRIYDNSGTNPLWCYFPSLMVNGNGDMGMGFSGSRSNSFIGAYASYRAANGATPSVPFLIHAGNGLYGPGAWGDYSYTTLDPLDDCTFWTVQQYAEDDTVNDNAWGTWISEIIPNSVNP